MKKIIFWNVERLSPKAELLAQRAVNAKTRTAEAAGKRIGARAAYEPPRPVTRQLAQQVKRSDVKRPDMSREARMQALYFNAQKQAEQQAEKIRNKRLLSEDLPASAPHVFFCEVGATHDHAQNSLAGHGAPGGATLCYARYQQGASSAFTHCAVADGWYAGPALPATMRAPKGVTLVGTAGPVRFCFWHAPSGNNGAIVAQMFNGLVAGGAPTVLFGDLNAEPNDVVGHGVAAANIVRPLGMTRISGRCLDYAISNVPARFNVCRPLYTDAKNYQIKMSTGSDHMVMVLELK